MFAPRSRAFSASSKHEHGGALAHHEPVAAGVERARDAEVRHRVERAEGGARERHERGLRAAGDDGVGARRTRSARRPRRSRGRRPRRPRAARTTARGACGAWSRRRRRRCPSSAGSRAARPSSAPCSSSTWWLCVSVPMPPIPVPTMQPIRRSSYGVLAVPARLLERLVGGDEGELREAIGPAHLLDREERRWARTPTPRLRRPRCPRSRRSSVRGACGRPPRAG